MEASQGGTGNVLFTCTCSELSLSVFRWGKLGMFPNATAAAMGFNKGDALGNDGGVVGKSFVF